MQIDPLGISGSYLIKNFVHQDSRGMFIKTFSHDLFHKFEIQFEPKEIYYSISDKNVIRGMHFQLPPKGYTKLIYVALAYSLISMSISFTSFFFSRAIS